MPRREPRPWQAVSGALLVVGLFAVQIYWASPYRTINHDFQRSVHWVANALARAHAHSVVTIGMGPYPEHGVGWEAGVYAAYFAGARIIGDLSPLPSELNGDSVLADVKKLDSDAVVIWGSPGDSTYTMLVSRIRQAYPLDQLTIIHDPHKGEVATVLILKQKS